MLVADDNSVYRRSLGRAVHAATGLVLVGVVASGEAAVAAARTLAPDVLLVDQCMPGLDGISVLERLGRDDIVKVLVSASLDADVERRAGAAGASACLPKDLSCSDICAAALALAHR